MDSCFPVRILTFSHQSYGPVVPVFFEITSIGIFVKRQNHIYDTIRYGTPFAWENWQVSCEFHLAHKLKKN